MVFIQVSPWAYGHFRTWGVGDFIAGKIYAIRECVMVEIGIQTHSNCTINKIVHNFHISRLKPCGRKFLWEFNFADFGFLRFRGTKFREFGFQTTRGNNFCGFHVQYLKVTKNGSHLVFFVTLFATNFIEVQQCKKARSKFLREFCWREFVFTGFNYHRSMKNPRNSR